MAEVITDEMGRLRKRIQEVVRVREALKKEMEAWYASHQNRAFKRLGELSAVDEELSGLDTRYKKLWDEHNAHH